MDKLDVAIVRQLQEDARKPFTEIALLLSVAEGTVRNRVSRLLEDGILQLNGTFDPHKVGFDAPTLINVTVQAGQLERVAAELALIPEVSYLVAVTGNSDLMVELMCRDHQHLLSLVSEKIHQISGIISTNTSMILRVYKELLPPLEPRQQKSDPLYHG